MKANQHIKIIGANGQLSLGKEFAGKMVVIDQLENGSWIIKPGVFIPDSEKWLYQGSNIEKLDHALEWAEKNDPRDNFDQLALGIENG